MKTRIVATALLLMAAAGTAGAEPMPVPIPHIYVSPTVGIWRWDAGGARTLKLTDRDGIVLGGRIGYAPIQAFSGELVVLTGTNTVQVGTTTADVRLTQVEFSFLVNFQNLLNSRVFPFLDLGSGYSARRGDATVDQEDADFDMSHVSFHLGGGVKADLTPRLGLRFNVRDTFFTESIGRTGQENQVTVDAVEVSGGVEYRIGWGARRHARRLR